MPKNPLHKGQIVLEDRPIQGNHEYSSQTHIVYADDRLQDAEFVLSERLNVPYNVGVLAVSGLDALTQLRTWPKESSYPRTNK